MPEVAEVHIANEYERPVEKPEMLYSKELVQAHKLGGNMDIKGKGWSSGLLILESTHLTVIWS